MTRRRRRGDRSQHNAAHTPTPTYLAQCLRSATECDTIDVCTLRRTLRVTLTFLSFSSSFHEMIVVMPSAPVVSVVGGSSTGVSLSRRPRVKGRVLGKRSWTKGRKERGEQGAGGRPRGARRRDRPINEQSIQEVRRGASSPCGLGLKSITRPASGIPPSQQVRARLCPPKQLGHTFVARRVCQTRRGEQSGKGANRADASAFSTPLSCSPASLFQPLPPRNHSIRAPRQLALARRVPSALRRGRSEKRDAIRTVLVGPVVEPAVSAVLVPTRSRASWA